MVHQVGFLLHKNKDNIFIGKPYGKRHFAGLGCWWQNAQIGHVL